MRPLISRFNGDRLKKARILNNLTILQLAEKVGVTKQSISLLENSKNDPKPETMFNLCNVLGYSKRFFYEEDFNLINEHEVFFRSLASTTKTEQFCQTTYLTILADTINFMSKQIRFSPWNAHNIDFSDMSPKEAALKLREAWNLGLQPIQNVVKVLEIQGVIISSVVTGRLEIDACSYPSIRLASNNHHPIMILSEDKSSYVRRQFDAAHELGHIILHKDIRMLDLSNEELKLLEREADDFASEFLLPQESFIKDIVNPSKLSSYKGLKLKWRVSIAAMIVKAFKSGVIDNTDYQKLMKQLSIEGGRKREVYDDDIPLTKPVMLKKAVDMMLQSNKLPNNDFIAEMSVFGCSYKRDEVEYVLGLEEGYLKPTQKGVVVRMIDQSDS